MWAALLFFVSQLTARQRGNKDRPMPSSTRKNSEVNVSARMLSAPMPGGMMLRIAAVLRCGYCDHLIGCDPEAGEWPNSFGVICRNCHRDLINFDRRP
jgi:hypothetical protein